MENRLEIASIGFSAVGAILMVYASVFADVHRSIALWINFAGAVLILFGPFLYVQDCYWEEESIVDKPQPPSQAEKLAQRAWLSVHDPGLKAELGKPVIVTYKLQNSGRTPGTIDKSACAFDTFDKQGRHIYNQSTVRDWKLRHASILQNFSLPFYAVERRAPASAGGFLTIRTCPQLRRNRRSPLSRKPLPFLARSIVKPA